MVVSTVEGLSKLALLVVAPGATFLINLIEIIGQVVSAISGAIDLIIKLFTSNASLLTMNETML